MSKAPTPLHNPVPIGDVSNPSFVVAPDPASLFKLRADRLHQVAQAHQLGPYLGFLADIADVQHRIQDGLPEPELPADDAQERARQFNMPPLDRSRFVSEPAFEAALDSLFAEAAQLKMPEPARQALDAARNADSQSRDAMMRAVLADAIPMETLASHVYVAAALQVHMARIASRLDASRLVPVGDAICPVCGGPPVTSVIVGWQHAANTRYCVCALCQTWWHYVRIRCTACGTTKGIGYKEVDGATTGVQAETCEECKSYVKILHQHKFPMLEPVADDVATLGLDMLVRDAGYRRGAFNPYLLGY